MLFLSWTLSGQRSQAAEVTVLKPWMAIAAGCPGSWWGMGPWWWDLRGRLDFQSLLHALLTVWLSTSQSLRLHFCEMERWPPPVKVLGGLTKTSWVKCLSSIMSSRSISFLSGRAKALDDGAWLPAPGYPDGLTSARLCPGSAQGLRNVFTTCLLDGSTLLPRGQSTGSVKARSMIPTFEGYSF